MKDYKDKNFLAKVAVLYYMRNLTQQEIAKKLGITRTKVSRYLEKARNENIVEIRIHSPKESFDEAEYLLEERYQLKECILVPNRDHFHETTKELSFALVGLLERILKDGDFLGVNWGNTLKSIVDAMEVDEKIQINVVPMMGGLGKIGTGVQTNMIAKNIADKFGGLSYMIHTPAVVDSKEIKEILQKDSGLHEIWDLIEDLSAAILGVSFADKEATLTQMGVFSKKDFEKLQKMGIVGDINLTFIDQDGNFIDTFLDERIIRTPFEKIRKCPNVIGIAFGEKKVLPLKAVLRARLINVLLTDQDTAQRLLQDP